MPKLYSVATRRRIAGTLAIFLVCLQVLALVCRPPSIPHVAPLLQQTWDSYKSDFITGNGQVRDFISRGQDETNYRGPQRTTSEGQSYGMLRAVWMGDRREFDLVWGWTRKHLQVRHDHLFAWLGTREQGGRWQLESRSSASDADEDIALALIFAGHRWKEKAYISAARLVLDGIWRSEVTRIGGRYYLTAGDWASTYERGAVVNPSYLAPYAYRVFAAEDPRHPWAALISTSYDVLDKCTHSTLGESRSRGLPPNWCVLDRRGAGARPFPVDQGTDYGYDAFRVMWRVALDGIWFGSPEARRYLNATGYLRQQWSRNGWLAAQYRHDGAAASGGWEDPTVYGGDIGSFLTTDPPAAASVFREKLLVSFHRAGGAAYWGDRWSYYQQNWVWFGVALAGGQLPNLAAGAGGQRLVADGPARLT
jgi:endo-1,4-beta-D-glucanase Y